MSRLDYQFYYERNLPHLQPPGATLFITFRLTGSIPVNVQRQLHAETVALKAALSNIADPDERREFASEEQRRLFGKWDSVLNTMQFGPTWLRDLKSPNSSPIACITAIHKSTHCLRSVLCLTMFTSSLHHCRNLIPPIMLWRRSCNRSRGTRPIKPIASWDGEAHFGSMKALTTLFGVQQKDNVF